MHRTGVKEKFTEDIKKPLPMLNTKIPFLCSIRKPFNTFTFT